VISPNPRQDPTLAARTGRECCASCLVQVRNGFGQIQGVARAVVGGRATVIGGIPVLRAITDAVYKLLGMPPQFLWWRLGSSRGRETEFSVLCPVYRYPAICPRTNPRQYTRLKKYRDHLREF
jgi:hypothetical protein